MSKHIICPICKKSKTLKHSMVVNNATGRRIGMVCSDCGCKHPLSQLYEMLLNSKECATEVCKEIVDPGCIYCKSCIQARRKQQMSKAHQAATSRRSEQKDGGKMERVLQSFEVPVIESWYSRHPEIPEETRQELDRAQMEIDAALFAKTCEGHSPARILSREEIAAIAHEITPIEQIPCSMYKETWIN